LRLHGRAGLSLPEYACGEECCEQSRRRNEIIY
jgi:hypothetical protein